MQTMNTENAMKTPTVQLTPEIIVSPRLYRFMQRYADTIGGELEYLLEEELIMNIDSLRDYRLTKRKAASLGLSYSEYLEHMAREVKQNPFWV